MQSNLEQTMKRCFYFPCVVLQQRTVYKGGNGMWFLFSLAFKYSDMS